LMAHCKAVAAELTQARFEIEALNRRLAEYASEVQRLRDALQHRAHWESSPAVPMCSVCGEPADWRRVYPKPEGPPLCNKHMWSQDRSPHSTNDHPNP
jgi:hypothetical protein